MPPYTYENATTIETQREAALRRTAMLDYWLHIIGAIFSMGVLSLLALIINYIQRPSARGSIYESHFTWMIRTCWWALIPFIWFLYRMIKGLLRANAYQPMLY